jgi:hypothetical protein
MEFTFYGTLQPDGKFTLNNPENFQKQIQHLKYKTKPAKIRVQVSRVKKARTTGAPGERSNMNGYYWLYIGVIADETGDNPNELHEYFKRVYLPPKYVKVLGREVKLPASTTDLTGQEMMHYMMQIEGLTGVPIPPHPDEDL